MTNRLTLTASSLIALVLGAGVAVAGSPDKSAETNAQLVTALRNDDSEAVKVALTQRADPNQVLNDSSTPLYIAIDHQDVDAVRALLAAGAKADVTDQDGNSALLLACQLGNADIVNSLLDAHADTKTRSQDNISPFLLCAGSTSPEVLDRMIAAGEAVDQLSDAGQTALMYAAANGQVGNVQTLLRHGAKVNAASKSGWTPIMFSMRGGSAPTIQALIAAGADVSHLTPDGATALQIAMEDRNAIAASLLVNNGASLKGNWDLHGRTPLQMAVIAGNVDLVKLMIAKGADANELSRLAYGINPNDISYHPPPGDIRYKPRTPIDFKALGYTPRIMLHTNLDGGGPAAIPAAPTTALLLAAQTGQADVMRALVAGGAAPRFVNGDGLNVLMGAASSKKLEAIKYAYEIYPDIKTTRRDGSSLLHIVLGGGGGGGGIRAGEVSNDELLEDAKFLVAAGAPLNAKNDRGQTPLALALDRGDEKMQTYFKQISGPEAVAAASAAGNIRTAGFSGAGPAAPAGPAVGAKAASPKPPSTKPSAPARTGSGTQR